MNEKNKKALTKQERDVLRWFPEMEPPLFPSKKIDAKIKEKARLELKNKNC